ncbi:MAG: hypothetical protein L3J92_00230 [Thermoplasmata archaeon]|jgi:uncharacterized membrane protein YozB (DUF420 family)|nr:hypothetical protein [Thermoplasmata archaeon]
MLDGFPPYAPNLSDLLVVVEIALAVMLVVGLVLVRTGHVRAHMILQSSIIFVNIPIVLYGMVPAYLTYVLPYLAADFGQPTVFVPTIMLVCGAAAEALGIYIILVAGTNWIPERLRFRRYKLWMRTELVLWWGVVIAGLTTYWLFWVPGASL